MIFKKFYLGRIFSFAFGAIAKRVFTNDCYNVKVIHWKNMEGDILKGSAKTKWSCRQINSICDQKVTRDVK